MDNDRGRPSKLPKFLEAMKKVLLDDRTVILTDVELLTLVNDRLKKSERIAMSTFEHWKAPAESNRHRSPENNSKIDADMVEDFRHVLGLARVKQKMNLSDKLTDPNSKNAWGASFILERKFEDLRKHNGIQIAQGGITLNIEGSGNVKKLVETIDIDFEEIKEETKKLENNEQKGE